MSIATDTATATDSAMKEPFTKYTEYLNNLVMFLIFNFKFSSF